MSQVGLILSLYGLGPAARGSGEAAMTSAEVRAIVEAEVAGDWSRSNWHGVDLRRSIVQPRSVTCRNTFPQLNGGDPLKLWIVLEEMPGTRDGYLIVFDDQQRIFGLAVWDIDMPVLVGFYGGFLNTLQAM